MLIKSALRDLLSVSYGLISILMIGSLRSPPPIRLRRTSPASGGRIGFYAFLQRHSSISKQPKGEGISSPAGRLYGFIQTGAFYNLKAPYNNPRARGASNLSPLRTFGPAGRQPSSPKGACPKGAHQLTKKAPVSAGAFLL